MKISLHPAAERDVLETAAFYEREGSPALAARYVSEFKRMASLLTEHPQIGAPRSHGRRGIAMNIFPYTIIDNVVGEELQILVVKHDKRSPGYESARS